MNNKNTPYLLRNITLKNYNRFLPLYDDYFAYRLDYRAESFRSMFMELEKNAPGPFKILETGTVRKYWGDGQIYGAQVETTHPWYPQGESGPWSDGQSTLLFDAFVNFYSDEVRSVDSSHEAIKIASSIVSKKTTIIHDDSVKFLSRIAEENNWVPDLIYFDSYDCDWENPHPSSLHHLKELAAIRPILKPGTVLAVDDCLNADGRQGKGMYIKELMNTIGAKNIHSSYQMVWRL